MGLVQNFTAPQISTLGSPQLNTTDQTTGRPPAGVFQIVEYHDVMNEDRLFERIKNLEKAINAGGQNYRLATPDQWLDYVFNPKKSDSQKAIIGNNHGQYFSQKSGEVLSLSKEDSYFQDGSSDQATPLATMRSSQSEVPAGLLKHIVIDNHRAGYSQGAQNLPNYQTFNIFPPSNSRLRRQLEDLKRQVEELKEDKKQRQRKEQMREEEQKQQKRKEREIERRCDEMARKLQELERKVKPNQQTEKKNQLQKLVDKLRLLKVLVRGQVNEGINRGEEVQQNNLGDQPRNQGRNLRKKNQKLNFSEDEDDKEISQMDAQTQANQTEVEKIEDYRFLEKQVKKNRLGGYLDNQIEEDMSKMALMKKKSINNKNEKRDETFQQAINCCGTKLYVKYSR